MGSKTKNRPFLVFFLAKICYLRPILTSTTIIWLIFVNYAIETVLLGISFWWFFAQSYSLMSLKKCSKWIFEKIIVCHQGGFDPKKPLAEKWPFEPISLKLCIRFWWFFTDVRYHCLMIWHQWCVLENSIPPWGILPPKMLKSPLR